MNIQVSFMQAIETKFHGPTNTKGARISATTTAGHKKYFGWDHSLNVEQNHIEACKAMLDHMGWDFDQKMTGAPTEHGYVFAGHK